MKSYVKFLRSSAVRQRYSVLATLAVGAVLSLAATACTDDAANDSHAVEQSAVVSARTATTPPGEVFVKGKRFVLRRRDVPDESTRMVVPTAPARDASSKPTEDELAEAMRPVLLEANSRAEYVMAGSNIEAARQAMGAQRISVSGNPGRPPSHALDFEEDVAKEGVCCGIDTRQPVRDNKAYWNATLIALAHPVPGTAALGRTTNANWKTLASTGGSAALIGKSTALSCGHAFYEPGVGWLPTKIWGTAVDAGDSPGPIAAGYPQAYGHYWVSVPTAWQQLGKDGLPQWQYDFAILNFNDSSFVEPSPGNVAGWLGWGVYDDATINSRAIWNRGFAGGPVATVYPQIMGQYMTASAASINAIGWEIRSSLDTNGGTSGRPAVQYIDGGYRVVGTLSGVFAFADGSIYTRDRRFDSTYLAYMRAVSADY